MKLKSNLLQKILFTILLLVGMLLIANVSKASSDLKLRNLNFDIKLNSDGSMDVVETWKIKIEDTNTLFKTFELDSEYSGFSNPEVYEIDSKGREIKFDRINKEMYHVTKGSYYALKNSKGKYEIAWGVSVKNKTKTYQLRYTVNDCIKNYTDCSEIYWQLISEDSAIPADRVTGTIKLPKAVSNKDDLRAWAHGPLNGNVTINSKDKVSFEVDYLEEGCLLEFRIASLDKSIFTNATSVNMKKLDDILEEEEMLAKRANEQREELQRKLEKRERERKLVSIGLNIFNIVLIIVFAWKIIKYIKIIIQNPKLVPTQKLDYFRDIPNEKASPAEASFLYYFEGNKFGKNLPKIVSATILNLALKKYITFSTDNREGKEDIRITILNKLKDTESNNNVEELTYDEQVVYNILQKVPKTGEVSFTMKELNKYAKEHSSKFMKEINGIESKAKKALSEEKLYDSEILKNANKWSSKIALYISSLILLPSFEIPFMEMGVWVLSVLILLGIFMINAILCMIMHSKSRSLPQAGVDEAEKWKGLKRYMEDFSLLNEREVPELVLWEKYLVFATAFGIADKVIKQLKVKYPELSQMDENAYLNYTYMHLMYNNSLNSAFVTSLDNAISKAYKTGVSQEAIRTGYSGGNYSSGGGHGGGFSGGGGGHGGGSMGGR